MKLLSACSIVLLLLGSAFAQNSSKPWLEWSKKEAEKTLNDSAWAQTQVEERKGEPQQVEAVTQVAAPKAANRQLEREGESGEKQVGPSVKYRVRFLSAKPIRAAFARMLLLSQTQASDDLKTQLQGFVDRDFADYIVVVVSPEVSDERTGAALMRAFSSATTEALQQNVYLERKDGKRIFLTEYRAPINDGLGAKFVFKRALDGSPFLSETDNVRFFAQLTEKLKLNTKYKLAEMMYDGRLEY